MKDLLATGTAVFASLAFVLWTAAWLTVFPTIGLLWCFGMLK